MLKDYSHKRENPEGTHNIEESIILEDMARETPRVYVALDDHQVYHQLVVVEVEGNISKRSISIFIELGSSHSYVTPKVVENCYISDLFEGMVHPFHDIVPQ